MALPSEYVLIHQEEVEWLAILAQGEDLSKGSLTLITDEGPSLEESRAEGLPVLKQLQQQSHTALSFQVNGKPHKCKSR